jgi:hypothetical protein
VVLARMRLYYVSMERCQCESIEIGGREYFTRHPHRNELGAPALITKAGDREDRVSAAAVMPSCNRLDKSCTIFGRSSMILVSRGDLGIQGSNHCRRSRPHGVTSRNGQSAVPLRKDRQGLEREEHDLESQCECSLPHVAAVLRRVWDSRQRCLSWHNMYFVLPA